jgi:vitamin B12 transporter
VIKRKLGVLGMVMIFSAITTLIPTFLSAQTELELDPTLVEGRLIEEKLSAELAAYGHKVNIIQGETIKKLGVNDLSQVLMKLVPGMAYVPRSKADYGRSIMNGSKRILWLVDGIRINNRLYVDAYIDAIGIHMIERIEVLTGGEGLFYGTEAVGGVINVITKKPGEDFGGEVGVSYGSYGSLDSWANIGGTIKGHKFMAFASYDSSDGYVPYKEETFSYYNNPHRTKRAYDRLNVGLKYSKEFDLSGYSNLYVGIQRNSGTFDYPYPNMYKVYNKRDEYIATLKWDHDVTPNYSYYIKAYYHSWWSDYTSIMANGAYTRGKPSFNWGYQDWGFNFLNSLRWDSGHELLVGLDYQNYWGKDEFSEISPNHEQVYAGFFQFRPHFSFWEDWKLAFGARYNYMTGDQATHDTLVWNVSSLLPILPGEKLFFKTNIGTAFVLPVLDHLYANNDYTVGNPNIRPEEIFSVTAGFGGRSKYFDWDVDFFFNETTDRIITGPHPSGKSTYLNAEGDSVVKGFSLEGTLKPIEGLSFSGSFTKNYYEIPSDGDIRSFAKLSAQWDGYLDEYAYGIGVYSNYIGKREFKLSGLPPINVGDYWLVDLRMYFKPTPKLTFTLALENLFNQEYAWHLSRVNYAGALRPFANPLGNKFAVTVGATYEF